MTLFKHGDTILHSGAPAKFEICCDALTTADLDCLARSITRKIHFRQVLGVPKGGLRLAEALLPFCDVATDTMLLVDDVLTTGNSMELFKLEVAPEHVQGVVIFARGKCPFWVTPIFQMIL